MLYIRFPLSLGNVEDLLHERGIDVNDETVRYWWSRFGPTFASEIRRKRVQQLRAFSKCKWHVYEVFVKVNGKRHYLWRAVDHEGEVLEAVVTKRRNKAAALKYLKKLMKRHGRAEEIVTDRFASCLTSAPVVLIEEFAYELSDAAQKPDRPCDPIP